jgi:hypothetical protein
LLSIKFSILPDLGDNMQTITKVHKVAAFTAGEEGVPAGVMIRAALPEEPAMQRIAAEMGYSETVFAAPQAMAGACAIFRRMARWLSAAMPPSRWAPCWRSRMAMAFFR